MDNLKKLFKYVWNGSVIMKGGLLEVNYLDLA